MADDDNKQIIEENEMFPKEVDDFIDGLIEEGYDIEDIEAVLTDDDFLAKLDDLDAEYEDEDEQLDEMGKMSKAAEAELNRHHSQAVGRDGSYKDPMARQKKAEADSSEARSLLRRERGKRLRAKKLTKEETESMMKDISKGKLGFGQVTPILANAAYCAIKRMPEEDRAGVIEAVWNDQDEFRFLITSQND